MQLIQLGEVMLNEQLSLIIVDGQEIPLDPKLLELLLLFCQQADQIICRQEILDKVWTGSIVTDNAVNKLVANLRKVLGDDPKKPKYIQTIPKRGYRLICPVLIKPLEPRLSQKDSSHTADTPVAIEVDASYLKRKQYVLAAIILMVFVGYALLLMRPSLINATSAESDIPNKNTQELTRMLGIEHSGLMSDKQDYLVFLRQDQKTGTQQLWRKNLNNNNEYRITGALTHISRLISLTGPNEQSQLVYLAQGKHECAVVRSDWLSESQLTEPKQMLDCSSFRVSDITWHAKKSQLIYSARAFNESTHHIYRFDLTSKTQQLLTQPDINGVGNSGLDLSPDGRKLLIVNNDAQYNSQLFVLDLTSNELTPALRVDYNISEAIWYHDSKRVLYFGHPPSHQIKLSDLNGEQQHTLLNASDYLKNGFTRIKQSQDILFSTANSNFSNRWLKQAGLLKEVNNSTVFDTQPALAHQSPSYAFISTRSGQDQLYYGNFLTGDSQVISQFKDHKTFTSLAFSPNDEYLLLTEYTKFWILSVDQLLQGDIPLTLKGSKANFHASGKLIQTRWLTNDLLYFVVRNDKNSKHYIFDKTNHQKIELTNRWSTLVTDHSQTDLLYLLDKYDNQLYKMPIQNLNVIQGNSQVRISKQVVEPTQIYLPSDYTSLKMHQQKVHYIVSTDDINLFPNSYNLHIQSLTDKDKINSMEVFKISCNCGYDVSDSGLMVSERISLEGDIHRTINK